MKSGSCPKCGSHEVYLDSSDHGLIVPIRAFGSHQTHMYVVPNAVI